MGKTYKLAEGPPLPGKGDLVARGLERRWVWVSVCGSGRELGRGLARRRQTEKKVDGFFFLLTSQIEVTVTNDRTRSRIGTDDAII